MPPIHVAITRRVKPGREAEFEAALLGFFQRTMFAPGVLGAQVVRPEGGEPPLEYGVLRTFESPAARDAFYASKEFQEWQAEVSHLVLGEDYERRDLHGLEAFFRGGGAPPPRWKMAILTWLGVFPSVVFWSAVFKPLLPATLPHLAGTVLITICVTVTLAWVVMPLLTKLFHLWLHPKE